MDNQPELQVNEDLTHNLKEYIDLSSQIQNVKKELKVIGERRKELEQLILNFMQTNSIDVLKTQGGSIKLYDAKSRTPLNEEYLTGVLKEKIDATTMDEIILAAFKSRPVTETQKIKLGSSKK
jgi:hypothetical protein